MTDDDLLNVQMTDRAEDAYTTLTSDDRRLLDAWFDHLRHWRTDEFIRSRSRLLESADALYVFENGSDLLIFFKVADDTVTVLSIFRKETLRKFEARAEQCTP